MSANEKHEEMSQSHKLKLHIPADSKPPPTPPNTAATVPPKKPKRRDQSDLGDNFVAPDGGWGWVVAFASGINILVSFAMAQQFGIIFRDRMRQLGISSSELTTIINIQLSVSAITGLLNGPLFRRYTFRQVALVGSFLTFTGLFLLVFADSFLFFVVSYSCFYGFGRGLTVSASSLAVNTYFKLKRRTATAYQFGVAGLGPIIFPYLATYLLLAFDVQGTVLIFAGLALHTFACSLIYQPVLWHVKRVSDEEAAPYVEPTPEEEEIIDNICEPETPTLPRANDGWFGSRTSLNTLGLRNRLSSRERSIVQIQELRRMNSLNSEDGVTPNPRSFNSIPEEREEELLDPLKEDFELAALRRKSDVELKDIEKIELDKRDKLPFYKKVIIFFDLDLMRDVTYANLSIGLTLINFVEINFAILTPFILYDFGLKNSQIAFAMSSLGFCDLVIRFLIPLITARMKLTNKAFFCIGVSGMCIGRVLLSFVRDFYAIIGIFIFMGLNKAFRTVFWTLIIPGYVPLKRLPAASGLQLLMSGTFALAFGPLIGLLRDNTNYTVTLNALNAVCIVAILMWVLEYIIRRRTAKNKEERKKVKF